MSISDGSSGSTGSTIDVTASLAQFTAWYMHRKIAPFSFSDSFGGGAPSCRRASRRSTNTCSSFNTTTYMSIFSRWPQ